MADVKKPSGFQIFLGEMLVPKTAIQKAIAEDTDGSTGELVKTANVSLYPVTDTVLENWAAKSKTKLDDKAIGQMKALQEELAEEGGYELPNLDAD